MDGLLVLASPFLPILLLFGVMLFVVIAVYSM